MKTYKAIAEWTTTHELIIEANNIDEALDKGATNQVVMEKRISSDGYVVKKIEEIGDAKNENNERTN
tara:strand:- start:428 stop:628 length:201 start_codon:yes stop_codon:yes gene_type:complete